MKRLFWVDLEMTGLDDVTDRILEVAIVVSDLDLNPLEELHKVVFQPPEVLEKMDNWCRKIHGESGLTAAVPQGMPLDTLETEVLQLISRHFDPQEKIVLAGNSVGNDKRFIDRHMPRLAQRLHYRIIDVSSFKEIFREKYNLAFEKQNAHRARDDIFESMKELGFYLSFVQAPKPAKPKAT